MVSQLVLAVEAGRLEIIFHRFDQTSCTFLMASWLVRPIIGHLSTTAEFFFPRYPPNFVTRTHIKPSSLVWDEK